MISILYIVKKYDESHKYLERNMRVLFGIYLKRAMDS